MERYINCSEKLGFSDGLHNIGLNKKISVPVFLLRSLRKIINLLSHVRPHSDQQQPQQPQQQQQQQQQPQLPIDKPVVDYGSPVTAAVTRSPQVVVVPQSATPAKPSWSATDWHGSIVQLTCNIFDGAHEVCLEKVWVFRRSSSAIPDEPMVVAVSQGHGHDRPHVSRGRGGPQPHGAVRDDEVDLVGGVVRRVLSDARAECAREGGRRGFQLSACVVTGVSLFSVEVRVRGEVAEKQVPEISEFLVESTELEFPY